MTQEDKQLLLVDLCARLPYGVKVQYNGSSIRLMQAINIDENEPYFKSKEVAGWLDVKSCKPYLRPIPSMTEEEKGELLNHVLGGEGAEYFHIAHDGSIDGNQEAEQDLYNLNLHWLNFGPLTTASYIDWLNKKMFDFRGLIEKDAAIAVTKDNNPYK